MSLATSAILALSGSDPGPLNAPRSLVVTFALLEAHALSAINIRSGLLAAVAVPTILLAVAHSETFALSSIHKRVQQSALNTEPLVIKITDKIPNPATY